MPRLIIAPSVLAADFCRLGDCCEEALSAGAEWLHLDVMDGQMVPNISIGFPVIQSLSRRLKNFQRTVSSSGRPFLDVHMMVVNPSKWLMELQKAGASQVCFHAEVLSPTDLVSCAQEIRKLDMRAAIAFKPGTEIADFLDVFKTTFKDEKSQETSPLFSMVLVMTVEPGFGGQSFIESCMTKVSYLRSMFPEMDIQVDGGITPATARIAAKAGANVFVAGTAIFGAPNLQAAFDEMILAVQEGAQADNQ